MCEFCDGPKVEPLQLLSCVKIAKNATNCYVMLSLGLYQECMSILWHMTCNCRGVGRSKIYGTNRWKVSKFKATHKESISRNSGYQPSKKAKLIFQGLQSLVIFKIQLMNGCHHPMMEDHNSSRSIVGPTFDDGGSDPICMKMMPLKEGIVQ